MRCPFFSGPLRLFHQYKPLVYELVIRDLKTKYRRSFLGYVWSLLNPLLMMAIMTVVFSYMFRFDIPNYPLYLICGQTLWNFFSESTTVSMYSVIQNGSLIRKVYIPKYIFPLSRVLSSFVTMSFSLVAILIVMLVTGVPFTFTLLLTPVPLLLLLFFCMGLGMALSTLAVYFRDTIHLYGVFITAWMYLTPVFYPISVLPEEIAAALKLNPLYYYVSFFRNLVLDGIVPGVGTWVICGVFSLASFIAGLLVFRRLQRNFILHV
jgi:ABC-2 type transport system permease protein